MPPVSKAMVPNTWVRRMSQVGDHRYTSDGNSSNYSSTEESHRHERQNILSFMMNDELGCRSYVDPWDMENYSFIRKQLEDMNFSDNEHRSQAFDSTQSDCYYVPLDPNGSPQYQYKRFIDVTLDEVSPQSLRTDSYGVMANVDEYDFHNEQLDSNFSLLHIDDHNFEFHNPSRQSERSRYNNQDYQTYTPPSIIKPTQNSYSTNQMSKLRRRASVSFRPDTSTRDFLENNSLSSCHHHNKAITNGPCLKLESMKSLSDVKIKLNRRKSFHDFSTNPNVKFGKQERRKSVLDRTNTEKWQRPTTDAISEDQSPGVINNNRDSLLDKIPEMGRRILRGAEKGILQNPENRWSRTGLNVYFENDVIQSTKSSHSQSPILYVYETAKRKRRMFLPSGYPNIFGRDEFRYSQPIIQDAFSVDPIEQYLNRPTGRYTMTNYGHLKIDYSCSWSYLDRCIAQRVCL